MNTELYFEETAETEVLVNREKKQLLIVRKGSGYIALPLMQIAMFVTENKIVFAITRDGQKYMTDKNLTELEAVLDDHLFFRANRKFIINAFYIKGFQALDRVKLLIDMSVKPANNVIVVSQLTAPAFKKWMHAH